MRLHNRQVKADFWTDPDLLQLHRDMRTLYHGLWHCAEDSGCLEDSAFTIKILLFPSPLDAEITVERIAEWIEHFVSMGKVVRYEVQGKRYLFLTNFHKHQKLRNPGASEVPLPAWVRWTETQYDAAGKRQPGHYIVMPPYGQDSEQPRKVADPVHDSCGSHTDPVPTPYQPRTGSKVREDKVREGKIREDSSPPDSLPPDATEQERTILHELKEVKGYPLDLPKDLAFIRGLSIEFPQVDLLSQAKRWRTYKMDKPLEKKANPRLQFRHWIEIAARHEEGGAHNVRHLPIGKHSDPDGEWARFAV